jgi:PAS domain S-box-containing protein
MEERLWQRTFDSVGDAVLLLGPDMRIRRLNRAAEDLMRTSTSSVIGRPCHEIVHGLSTCIDGCPVARMSATRRREENDIPVGARWYRVVADPIFDDDGRLSGIVHVMSDITDQRRAKEALQRSQEGLAQAQRIAHLGSWDWDILGGTLAWSDEVYRIFGLQPGVFGATYEAFLARVHPEDRSFVTAAVDRALADPSYAYSVEHRVVRSDGSERTVVERGEVTRDAAGKPVRMMGTVLDITELKRTEEALQQSEAKYRRLYESAPDAFFSVRGEDGAILRCNAAAVRLLGHDRAALLKMKVFDLYGDSEMGLPRAREVFARFRQGEAVRDVELEMKRKDGTPVWIRLSVTPVLSADGRVIESQSTVRDITDRKAAEAETLRLRQALAGSERLLRMGEMMASLAHELNQPLAAILSNAQAALRFMEAGNAEPAEMKEILKDIVSDDVRAGEVIRGLRAMVRREPRAREPLDLNRILGETVNLVRSELIIRNVHLRTSFHEPLPAVSGDKVQLQQVALNLILNAADALSDSPPDRRQVEVLTAPAGGGVRISVLDRGPGIPEEVLKKIFEPFFTTKAQGMGMGLAISRTIVEHHGGRVRAENRPEGGAAFHVELPGKP